MNPLERNHVQAPTHSDLVADESASLGTMALSAPVPLVAYKLRGMHGSYQIQGPVSQSNYCTSVAFTVSQSSHLINQKFPSEADTLRVFDCSSHFTNDLIRTALLFISLKTVTKLNLAKDMH
jgi:hypothetical protein